MFRESVEPRAESPSLIVTMRPAGEAFFARETPDAAWLALVAHDSRLREQCAQREHLTRLLDEMSARVPHADLNLEVAFAQNLISEKTLTEFYQAFATFFAQDADSTRLILYFPFEYLPATDWDPANAALDNVLEQFRQAYLTRWHSLLHVHDVRANFVDGDVLEIEHRTGDLPRVVKAAHLIPILLEKGFLSFQDFLTMYEGSTDPLLQRSIADTFPLLVERGWLSPETMGELVPFQPISPLKKRPLPPLAGLAADIQKQFAQIDAEPMAGLTEKRASWLQQEKKRHVLETLSTDIAEAIRTAQISRDDVLDTLASERVSTQTLVFVQAIRKAIITCEAHSPAFAKTIYNDYQEILNQLWQVANPVLHEELTKTFRHLHGLGLLAPEELTALHLSIPDFTGSAAEQLQRLALERADLAKILATIERDEELSAYIYPVALLFGSRVKGYGTEQADIDVAIFVKPAVPFTEEARLRRLLAETFRHEKIDGPIVEFWLEETRNGLSIRDGLRSPHGPIGGRTWTHLLFGAAWEGPMEQINELREELLLPYLFEHQKPSSEQNLHARQLEELERDLLQYRLMHKGYDRFFPPSGGLQGAQTATLDGTSTFWDAGYRRTATKLFVSKVFLPSLSLE